MHTDGSSTDTGRRCTMTRQIFLRAIALIVMSPRNLVLCAGRWPSVRYAVAILRYGGHV